jgi:hypothetical protein
MASIFSSQHGLVALAALEQSADGLQLTELARALDVSVSSAQAALRALTEDAFATRTPGRPIRYQLTEHGREAATRILDLIARRHQESLLRAALRVNPAVEFAGLDRRGLLLVLRWDATPSDELTLNRMLERLPVDVARFGHDEVREQLLGDQTLAARAARSRVLVGSVPRSFPDPFRHGDPDAPRLGGLHPDVRRPSRRALAQVARRYGLSEIRVFGSAVHADFRPDSDVDVMVKRKRGVRRRLEDDLALRRDLEALVGREVDVSDASVLRDPIRAKAETEGVVVYG